MRPDDRPGDPGQIDARTAVGYHPRDGRPVACWIVHPVGDGPAGLARLDRFAAALGLASPFDEHVTQVPEYRAAVTAAGGWATLWVGDEVELLAEHDEAWREAVVARGWSVVVVGRDSELATAPHGAVMEHLHGGTGARVGIVRIP